MNYLSSNFNIQWESPSSFEDEDKPELNTEVFPGWVRNYLNEVADAVQVSVDVPTFNCISLLSTILTKKFDLKVSNRRESLNTYTILSLRSGEGKSAVANYFLRYLTEFEAEKREELQIKAKNRLDWIKAKEKRIEQLTHEYSNNKDENLLNEIKEIRDEIESQPEVIIPRLFTEDATPEALVELICKNNGKMAILSAEAGEIFKMMLGMYSNSPNFQIYLDGFSGASIRVDRRSREPLETDSGLLTIGLSVQPVVIQELEDYFNQRGVTQRFLYSIPTSKRGQRLPTPPKISAETSRIFSENIK